MKKKNAGFTLLEIILALSLTAMLLSMLTAGVYGVVRDWDDNAAALESSLDQTISLLQLERALQAAFPHSYRDPDTLGRHVFFDGQQDQLSWVSTVSPDRSVGLMAWRLSNDPDLGVMLQLAPALTDDPSLRLAESEMRVLLPGYQAEFQYMYEDLQFSRRWREDWPAFEFNILPMAAHISFVPLDGDTDIELDIIAAIAAREHRSIRPNLELIR